jgi:single-strand DNA-binding protein
MEIKVKGRVGNDPEIKFVTQEQLPLVTFSLAYTPRSRKGNEWVDGETMWFRVAQFGKRAEAIADSIKKGDEVLVLGTVRESKYQGKDGSDKTSLEITATEIALIPRLQKGPRGVPTTAKESGGWQQGW